MLGRTDVRELYEFVLLMCVEARSGGNEIQQHKDMSPKNGTAQRADECVGKRKTRRTPRIVTRPALAARISTT